MSWRCYDPDTNDEFQVIYHVHNLGQCEERGSRTDDPFDLRTTQWSVWNRQAYSGNIYQHSATLYNLLPHSTYSVYLLSREPTGAGGYNYRTSDTFYPYPTTSEAGAYV